MKDAQGGPLSPLLSNIVLDEFVRELERYLPRLQRGSPTTTPCQLRNGIPM
jgi:hypothetical protein